MDVWDIYLTDEVADWLEQLHASDPKTAGLVDDAIYALSCPGPALGRPLADAITGSKIKNLTELRPDRAARARSASCSSSIPGARRSCW